MKRVKIIFALLSITILILSIILFEKHANIIGGTAIDGYKKDEVFYVCTAPCTYKQVDKMDWYYNFILSIIMLISGGCIVLLYGYFGVRYFYPWIKYKYYEDIYDPDKQEYLT